MGEKCPIKKTISFGLLLLLLFSMTGIADHQSADLHEESQGIQTTAIIDAELPQWSIGDRWVYRATLAGNMDEKSRFDLSIEQLNITVMAMSEEQYDLSVEVPRGQMSGNVRVQSDIFTIEGDIIDAKIEGMLYVKKHTLEMIHCQLLLAGFIDKLVDIPFSANIDLNFYNQSLMNTNFSTLIFPLTCGMQWVIPTTLPVANISLNLLPEPLSVFFSFVSHQFLCECWETISIGTKEYDALKLTGDLGMKNEIYYAVSAGNIIKLDYKNIDAGFGTTLTDVKMELLSTTYAIDSNSPSPPDIINGSHEPLIGQISEYILVSTDPDGDNIKYIIDWGDGETSVTGFLPSGEENTFAHQYDTTGTFEIKAKARDKYGSESSWSIGYSVVITNDMPTMPAKPTGPTTGKIKQSYVYTTVATDPDDHQIQYGWDWDGDNTVDEWTALTVSGQPLSTSHIWYTQGQFFIRVKSRDAYGSEGPWSDPLGVTMPKSKYMSLIHWVMQYHLFIQRLIETYSLQIL